MQGLLVRIDCVHLIGVFPLKGNFLIAISRSASLQRVDIYVTEIAANEG